jgi:excisionase family DNA binding protein
MQTTAQSQLATNVRLLISVPDAAQRCGLSDSLLYYLIQQGQFPHIRVRRRILVPVKAMEEWIDQQTRGVY